MHHTGQGHTAGAQVRPFRQICVSALGPRRSALGVRSQFPGQSPCALRIPQFAIRNSAIRCYSPVVLNHPEQYLGTLKSVDLFRGVSDQDLLAIGRLMAKYELGAGQVLFHEDDPCEGFYVIESGSVKIFKTSPSGREQVLAIERAGGMVAELPVFDDGPYPASCQAVESSLLLFLSKSDFRAICLESPELALKVLKAVGGRLRRLVGLIEELSFTTVRQRLAASLVRRAEQNGTRTGEGLHITLPANHEIGAEIGTVRELVSRNLSRFQAEGLIRMDGKDTFILDLEALRAEIEAS
jgi:CRP/FNR family transcriptional regulator, cyclic AMP receptor protein